MLADDLRDALKADRRTPYAIAKLAGVAPSVVTRFLNGKREPSLGSAGKLAEVLGLALLPNWGEVAKMPGK